MFEVGEIVEIFAPTAGKKKYHLCVCSANEHGVQGFLFINSGQGYDADFVLDDAQISCLPLSPTGNSVISCSLIVKYTSHQLGVYRARKLGSLDRSIALLLATFIETTRALPKSDRETLAANLRSP